MPYYYRGKRQVKFTRELLARVEHHLDRITRDYTPEEIQAMHEKIEYFPSTYPPMSDPVYTSQAQMDHINGKWDETFIGEWGPM